MRRLRWLFVGAILGILGYRRGTAFLRRLSPASLSGRAVHRAAVLGDDVRAFAHDVRDGMTEYSGYQRQSEPPRRHEHDRQPPDAHILEGEERGAPGSVRNRRL